MNKTKQQIEEVIKKNLPEKKEDDGFAQDPSVAFNNGFDEALSQIPVSLIADEVLKVVSVGLKEFMKRNYGSLNHQVCSRAMTIDDMIEGIENYLLTLSPNKENKNNE